MVPSSLTMSGSTLRFLPLSALEISASPTEPYRWPSSLALASIVMRHAGDLLGQHLEVGDLGLAGLLDALLVAARAA